MKSIYWHRKHFPSYIILLIAVICGGSMWIVQYFKNDTYTSNFTQKLNAAEHAYHLFDQVKKLRLASGIPINPKWDLQRSGLIGLKSSSITTDGGKLYAKQSSINPNFAAIFYDWLVTGAGLKKGDYIAVQMTGSYPALDLAMLAAIKEAGLNPLISLSVGASNYGLNIPDFSFPKVYKALQDKGDISWTPVGVSMGGSRDNGYGLTEKGRDIMKSVIEKTGYHYIESKGTIDSIDKHMKLYKEAAGNHPIAAFVNVGGSMVGIGLKRIESKRAEAEQAGIPFKSLSTGVISSMPITLLYVDSIAARYLKQRVPVVNVRNIEASMLKKYKLPSAPAFQPLVGEGEVFDHYVYNRYLAAVVLVFDVSLLLFMAWVSRKYLLKFKRDAS